MNELTMQFVVNAEIKNLGVIERELRALLNAEHDRDNYIVNELLIVIDEAFTNIVRHGYKGDKDALVDVTLTMNDDEITVTFVDDGPAFELEESPPELGAALLEKEELGLGVYIMRRLMHDVILKRINNQNHLTLVRKRSYTTRNVEETL